jgi:hypothetical protein
MILSSAGLPERSNGTALGAVGLVPTKVRILYPALEGLRMRNNGNFPNLLYPASFYIKLNNPFCKINIPIIMQIKFGTTKNIERIKTIPVRKSIQLAKSFNSPKQDLTSKITPKTIRRTCGDLFPISNNKINPLIKSIPPKTLISIFFKLSCCLKTYPARVTQPG